MKGIEFICPVCKVPLQGQDPLCCPAGHHYACQGGIWRMLPAPRRDCYARFREEYEAIRKQEGRGSEDPEFYRSLPFRDKTGRFAGQWRVRARSFSALLDRLFVEREKSGEKLVVADLGAGNGWLSYRLALRGHELAAVDLCDNSWDGLGAFPHYPCSFVPVQAEFDALPFVSRQFDIVIYNASFHYSTNPSLTLNEGLRVLKTDGQLVIMDSPLYAEASSGEKMLEEQRQFFCKTFGRRGDALPLSGYLTWNGIRQLGHWEWIEPEYGLRWKLRPWLAKLLGRREPARFGVLILKGR